MASDPYKGTMVIPFRVTCYASRCRSMMQGWTTSSERAEVFLNERGWKLKRGAWRCQKHWGSTAHDEFGELEEGGQATIKNSGAGDSGDSDDFSEDGDGGSSGNDKAVSRRDTQLKIVDG